jgi:tellurite methyltransferase
MQNNEPDWGARCSSAARYQWSSPGLLKALGILLDEKAVKLPGHAIDLGCGLGRDTRKLLADGFSVLAVDSNAYVIEKLEASTDSKLLHTQLAYFENVVWSPATLINAALALPYCPREQFGFVWSQILASLIKQGIVVADFFLLLPDQPRDEPQVASYSKEELLRFLSPLDIRFFQEWQGDFVNANNEIVKRLACTVIAQRKRY